jgi:hypothetical protein
MSEPTAEEVMREYFRRRVLVLKRERAAELLGLNSTQAVDYIKSGRNKIAGWHLDGITGERTARDLFAALADLARSMASETLDAEQGLPSERAARLARVESQPDAGRDGPGQPATPPLGDTPPRRKTQRR